jgi:hypothetical protein
MSSAHWSAGKENRRMTTWAYSAALQLRYVLAGDRRCPRDADLRSLRLTSGDAEGVFQGPSDDAPDALICFI